VVAVMYKFLLYRWYHILTREEHDKALAEKRRATKGRQLIHRPIRHPYFKNLTALQTAEALRDSDVGACLFTPSSRSTDQIKMTIKVCLCPWPSMARKVLMFESPEALTKSHLPPRLVWTLRVP